MAKSLFNACKATIRAGISGTHDVGEKTGSDGIFIEYYTQDDIDNDIKRIKTTEISACSFGNSDENNVVLVAGEDITVPEGFTLTPAYPKKSMVIFCNNLINNGTISMTAKAPNVLPHDWFIIGKQDGYNENVIIPAYAGNQINQDLSVKTHTGINGNNGINRQCGSGGTGVVHGEAYHTYTFQSGSGYAFGGGAGGGAMVSSGSSSVFADSSLVDTVYPMHGGDGKYGTGTLQASGGVGNPTGASVGSTFANLSVFGCGGRIIIFCNSFENNGIIISNGTANTSSSLYGVGGASGAGAIDIFYTTMVNLNSDNITVTGGASTSTVPAGWKFTTGAGGDGCITLSDGDQAPLWTMPDCFKPQEKYMSKANMIYFLGELAKRMNNDI